MDRLAGAEALAGVDAAGELTYWPLRACIWAFSKVTSDSRSFTRCSKALAVSASVGVVSWAGLHTASKATSNEVINKDLPKMAVVRMVFFNMPDLPEVMWLLKFIGSLAEYFSIKKQD